MTDLNLDDNEKNQGVVVPYERLARDVLYALIEAFVLREGTDYGLQEYSLEQKIEQVHRQLKSGRVCVVFDPMSESTSIMNRDTLTQ